MNQSHNTSRNITLSSALAFELALGVLALFLGWVFGHSPLASVPFTADALPHHGRAAGWGIVATLPMLLGLAVIESTHLRAFDSLKRIVQQQVVPLFAEMTWFELALLSLGAGVCEEMLFRGCLQDLLAGWLGEPHGAWGALALVSILFGICHYLTTSYALLATLIGVYMGWLYLANDNLVAPMVTHSLYDFMALAYLVKWKPSAPGGSEPESPNSP